MYGLTNFFSRIMKGVGAASRVFELEDRQPSIKTTAGLVPTYDAKGVIEFKNVKFAYPTRPGAIVFSNLNLKIQPGQNVCIVGSSGVGKSTLGM